MSKCIVCGSELRAKDLLMRCTDMPEGAQKIPSREELDHDTGITLNLYQCSACGLVQFDGEPVAYYRDVIRSGGYSSTMRELRRSQYSRFIDLCGLRGKRIIEIGCGQGEFLQVLTEFPVEAYGIEHNAALAEIAQGKGLNVWTAFADAESTELKGAPYDAFLSFNFLEHQPDPNGMLRCIYRNLTEEGYGLVTVPSFEYSLEQESYYELLHDHIANYTEDTLRYLMNRNGFVVLDCARINRDTLSAIVQKRRRTDVEGLIRNRAHLTQQLREFFRQHMERNMRIAIWGASHQAFTLIATTGIGENVSYIIDSAPFKQGKFAPVSHVPIKAPEHFFEEPVECILIVAPGYTEEIAEIIRSRFGKETKIFVLRSASLEPWTD